MTNPIRPTDGARSEGLRPVLSPIQTEGPAEEVKPVQPVDRVEISSEGLALLRESPEEVDSVKPYRPTVQEVLQRIREGFYDTPQVAESTARSLLESGDLGTS